jgi:segregation and condensation protein A
MSEDFDAPVRTAPTEVDAKGLIINIEGFEGPLDVLLALAQSQKVDLAKISILQLVEQYLVFVMEARRLKLELAADYLVMAAWLTYLKSKLLLPPDDEEEDGLSAEEMAARLAFQLQRLEGIRNVAARLMGRDRLNRDVFRRGQPQQLKLIKTPAYEDNLVDLLKAYSYQRVRTLPRDYTIQRPPVLAIEDARHRIETMLGKIPDWSSLDMLLPPTHEAGRKTSVASTFAAALELVRDGLLEVRQMDHFGPIFVKKRDMTPANDSGELGDGRRS